MKKRKSYSFKSVYIVVLVIVFLMVLLVFSRDIFGEGGIVDEASNFAYENLFGGDPNSPDESGSSDAFDYNVENSGESSGSGGSGSGSTGPFNSGSDLGGDPNQTLNCGDFQISYSIQNLVASQNCTKYSGETCTTKIVDCSLEALNLDDEIGGDFGINLNVVRDGVPNAKILSSFYEEKYIAPNSIDSFSHSFTIKSSGDNGAANRDLTCLYDTLKIPTKEVCE